MVEPDAQIWNGVLTYLRRNYPALCRQWFEQIEFIDLSSATLVLAVPQQVHLRYLQTNCINIFIEAAQDVTGRLVSVRFEDAATVTRPVPAPIRGMHNDTQNATGDTFWGTLYEDMVINPDYTFDHFVDGPNNRLAHAGAIAVSKQPGRSYNPFFIHGGVGLGKTHLLQAICHQIICTQNDHKIYYVSCEGFTSQFMESVRNGKMAEFRHRFRHIDTLVVDDIHFLAGHDRTQEEFFHTFNSLYQAGKQIILSSDGLPNEIPDLENRLVSRFNQGLVARMDSPCYETRVVILKTKAALRGLELPDDVACYVANQVDANIRELEGALTQLQGLAMATNADIDLALAQEAIGIRGPSQPMSISIQDIIAAVSSRFGVKPTDLLSKRRHKSIALPRQVAMYVARSYTDHSLQEIGGFFGGRDHTTVMHAVSRVTDLRLTDERLNHHVTGLETDLSVTPDMI